MRTLRGVRFTLRAQLLSFAATGLGFQLYAPGAGTAVEVWQQMLDRAAANRAQAM